MVGKLRIHEATVENVYHSEYDKKFYTIRITYERRDRHYSILLKEGTKKMKNFRKFLNVENLEELEGKTISYIGANDLNEPGKVEVWMLANKDRTSFCELSTGDILNKEQVEKRVKKFVLSEF